MSEYTVSTQFIDLASQQKGIRKNIDNAIKKVLDHGQYIMGPEVKEFEDSLQNYTNSKHAITCGNGTDALSLVLMAWGVGPKDAIFVPSFTYVATGEAPAQLGSVPFFVDVCMDTFNIDPISFKQAIMDSRKLGLNPSVVIAVDLFGQPADIEKIEEIAHEENIKVLVDGAQSFGATSNGRKVGSMGDATTTSFFPAKPLGCYGDGGAIFTENDEFSEIIRSIRLHGKGSYKYDNVRIGLNSRMDTIQAAILLEKLKIFDEELLLRSKAAKNYNNLLESHCETPFLCGSKTSAWAQYTLKLKNRDKIQESLKAVGIPSIIYYPIPLSKQIGYSHYPSVSSGVEVSSYLSKSVLSLPMHPYITIDTQEHIANEIIKGID